MELLVMDPLQRKFLRECTYHHGRKILEDIGLVPELPDEFDRGSLIWSLETALVSLVVHYFQYQKI